MGEWYEYMSERDGSADKKFQSDFSMHAKKVCQKCRQINCKHHGALQDEIVVFYGGKWYTQASHTKGVR